MGSCIHRITLLIDMVDFGNCSFDFWEIKKSPRLETEIIIKKRKHEKKLRIESRLNSKIQVVEIRLEGKSHDMHVLEAGNRGVAEIADVQNDRGVAGNIKAETVGKIERIG